MTVVKIGSVVKANEAEFEKMIRDRVIWREFVMTYRTF